MEIINKIYNWFRNIILNILGVIRYMNNNEVEIVKTKCDMAKYIIEKSAYGVKYIVEKSADSVKYVFGSRKIRLALGVALLISCINIPDDRKELDKGEC